MAPAIRLAAEGFIVDSALHRLARGDARDSSRGSTARHVFFAERRAARRRGRASGSRRWRARCASSPREGPRAFYSGEVADSLVAEMQRGGGHHHQRGPRALPADLARRRSGSTYRGYTLLTMPPASSGGVTMTETLNMLETYDSLADRSAARAYAHLLASAFQRAFIDRNAKLGDPAFVHGAARPS